jgi:hypothetical protein
MVFAQRKGHETLALVAALRLLVQKSPINCAVLTGKGKLFNTRWMFTIQKNNTQRHDPGPKPNNLQYF